MREVSQAGDGRRVLRVAASNLFAEHAAPGLIELFASRANDLEVELSVHSAAEFPALLATRTVDVAIGPARARRSTRSASCRSCSTRCGPWPAPTTRSPGTPLTSDQVRRQTWHLGPSAVETDGVVPAMLRSLGVPEQQQRIFQSHAAALEETTARQRRRARDRLLGVAATCRGSPGHPRRPRSARPGRWTATALARRAPDAGRRRAAALHHHAAGHPGDGPRRGRALGRFKPAVTSPSGADVARRTGPRRSRRRRPAARAACGRAGRRRRTAAPRPSTRPAARSPVGGRARVEPDHAPCPAAAALAITRGQLLGRVAVPAVRGDHEDPAAHDVARAATGAARAGTGPGACRRTGRPPATRPARRPPPATAARAPA